MWSGFKRGSRGNDTVTQPGSRGFNSDFFSLNGNKCAGYRQEVRGTGVAHTDCQYLGRNNILQVGMNRGAARARRSGAGRASARVRCETGNPRRGAAFTPVLAPPPTPPPEIIFTVLFLFFPSSPATFFSNRKMKCKSSFAVGGPGSPLSETRSAGAGCTAPVGANPEDGVGVPPPSALAWPLRRARPRSARDPSPAPPGGARGRSERGSPASPRVQVHPRVGARGSGSEFSLLGLAAPGTPLRHPPGRAGPAGLGRKPRRTDRTGTPIAPLLFPCPHPRPGRPPRPTWRLRLEKKLDFLPTLLRVEPGMGRKLLEHAAAPLQSASLC